MMKRNIFSLISLASILLFCSCEDFLSKDPDARATLDTPESISQLLVSAYPSTGYALFTETMSDNVGDARTWMYNHQNVEEAYWWKDVSNTQQDSPTGFWNSCYEAISHANHALDFIDKAPNPDDYLGQKGEALLCRAYAHFMLVNLFAKTYDKATAASDPGIPYVTEAEDVVFKKYERLSVAKVYELMKKDLEDGLPLIEHNQYKVPSYHFNTAAAYTFASRFYLFSQDWEKCAEYASMVIGSKPSLLLRDWNGEYASLAADAKLIMARYTKSDETCNSMLLSMASIWSRSATFRYTMTPAVKGQIFDQNITGGSLAYHFFTLGESGERIIIPKYREWFKSESINANYGVVYIMYPAFTMEEALLNRAEANVMLGNYEEVKNDLNVFYSKRIDAYNPSVHAIDNEKIDMFVSDQAADKLSPNYEVPALARKFLAVVVDTRRKEFAFEGMRWFDIRRFNIEITHTQWNGAQTETLLKDDPRRQLQLPKQVIASGMEPNPVGFTEHTPYEFVYVPYLSFK